MTFRLLAAFGLILLAVVPAFADGSPPTWNQVEALRQDRVQLGRAYHQRTRDRRDLTQELAVGNRGAATDIRRQLDGDDAGIVRARTRLRHDERTGQGG